MPAKSPTAKTLRRALSRLVARGPDAVWLPDVQPLLELPAVKAQIEQRGDDHAAEALQGLLRAAVAKMGQSQYRGLLTVVLELEPRYRGLGAGERRRIAGEEFRGGQDPVGAGTIRQHHEPRALDELTEILVSNYLHEIPLGSDSAELDRFGALREWHPACHQEWGGERLCFARIALGSYNRTVAAAGVREAVHRCGAGSWSVHELAGVFDLLLKVWLPGHGHVSDLRGALLKAFGHNLELYDYMTVDQVVSHWPWGEVGQPMRRPSEGELAARAATPLAMSDRDQDADSRFYADRDLLVDFAMGVGIEFAIVITPRRQALIPSAVQEGLANEVLQILASATEAGISEVSVFRGEGFGTYLIQARTPPALFDELDRLLIAPLNELFDVAGSRARLFVMSAAVPLAREEKLPGAEERRAATARELLEQGEGLELEIKASSFVDVRNPRGGSRKPGVNPKSGPSGSLMRAITGLLNANGGMVVIGAFEAPAGFQLGRLPVGSPLLDAPLLGQHLIPGVDHELGDSKDSYVRLLRRLAARAIEPDPGRYLRIEFEEVNGRTLCLIEVRMPDEWFYFVPDRDEARFVVRQGDGEDRVLLGSGADRLKMINPRGGSAGQRREES